MQYNFIILQTLYCIVGIVGFVVVGYLVEYFNKPRYLLAACISYSWFIAYEFYYDFLDAIIEKLLKFTFYVPKVNVN